MPRANDFLKTIWSGPPLVLNGAQAASLQDALKKDAMEYFYSGAVCIADAIRGASAGFYSWSTVKMYYATFYLAKCKMALIGEYMYYHGTKPFLVNSNAGGFAANQAGNSHKVILNHCADNTAIHPLLNQEISNEKPLDWLMRQREEVNYKSIKYAEPACPPCWAHVYDIGIRKVMVAIINDIETKNFSLACDTDYAILGFPVAMYVDCRDRIKTIGLNLSKADDAYLGSIFKDQYGFSLLKAIA